ncbi:related to permeases [Cephalotrichum gorgonifer]|uniref:Related to permeases n=1 Tax=Cephalotrichum gorgonifer TaxID=2041049 RepID=A0AAE8SWL1_9PEZI|nr:related to permeases [Cephalotrichum gorgonifer]
MAYVIAVVPSMVALTGGSCVCEGTAEDPTCAGDDEYALCVNVIKRDLVTATAAISALTSICMGLFANVPVGLAPGLGLVSYFTFGVVGVRGSGDVPYELALTATFVEGWIFFGLTMLGLRQWLAQAIPKSIKIATGVGIGMFLTMIGLTYAQGIGLIVGGTDTPLELAGCRPSDRSELDGRCPDATKMRNPTMWVGIFCGGFLIAVLTLYRIKGAVIIGTLFVSCISWPRATAITFFPDTASGDDSFQFFRQVVSCHGITKTLGVQQWDISGYGSKFGMVLITLLYVDILDCTGTLYSMAQFAGMVDQETQDFEGSTAAFTVDAIGISIGALLGVPPITAFVESGAGISEGGRTGLTAISTGVCFLMSIFFAPIFASIPPWATGCVLILVGSMMVTGVTEINWRYMGDGIPAFLTIVMMPFTYSIAYGLIAGICSYAVINTSVYMIETLSCGRIETPGKEAKDAWTWRVPRGGVFPSWPGKLVRGRWNFWRRGDSRRGGVAGGSIRAGREGPSTPDSEKHQGRSSFDDGGGQLQGGGGDGGAAVGREVGTG